MPEVVETEARTERVPLVAVSDLRKRYGHRPILRGVDLAIEAGQVVALLGANGAGKTTLMRSIAGLSAPNVGEVRLGGATVKDAGNELRRYVGVVSHAPLLYDSLTGLENLRFFADLYDLREPEARIEAILREVDLWSRRHDLVRTYSRGMVQRLAIGRAILHDPPVLLLDEPDTGLDEPSAAMLREVIRHLSASERAILFSTHNLDRALAWSDEVCILADGKIGARVSSAEVSVADLRGLYATLADGGEAAVAGAAAGESGGEMVAALSSDTFALSARRDNTHDLSEPANARLAEAPVRMATEGGWSAFWRKVWTLARKDLQTELRTKEVLGTMAIFAVLAVLIFGLGFDLRVPSASMVVPGVVWVVLLFTGVLGLNRAFGGEVEQGSMTALLLAPMMRGAIFCGKVLANWLFMLVTLVVMLPVVLVIFDTNLFTPWVLASLLLGTFGYVVVGTLFAALTANSRAREALLPVLLLPVLLPLFMAGLSIAGDVLDGLLFASFRSWFVILAVYGVFFGLLAFLVFDLIWEDG